MCSQGLKRTVAFRRYEGIINLRRAQFPATFEEPDLITLPVKGQWRNPRVLSNVPFSLCPITVRLRRISVSNCREESLI